MWSRALASTLLAASAALGCAPGAPGPAPMSPPRGPALPAAADGDGGEGGDDWDVNAPPGPTRTVSIDTDELTWTSVDVSPDGETIVFDALGDIYTVPLEGGPARALTEGMAWDMQPRFGPRGERIAFTSDRGGGDNIWVMREDGSEPRQLTRETKRLLNSPAWSPGGDYIVARKHFTGERSLGAGEIWLYHVAGGEGVAMTERPSEQKDVGEPALSPDGRYLYYSRDVATGKRFAYNKDPHAGIYAIVRLDREEGVTETVAGGPGGAVRPTPSPDGSQLAFVRRKGTDTVLAVLDLRTGAERIVYRDLDRDMQETWAIHGVYPQMAWTPDSREVVLWAGGKIRRVEVADGASEVVPVRVEDERTVTEALEFEVEVHPERFDTRMLRWVEVSPDGDEVVYQALGKIYIRPLPEGEPRRLTSAGEDVFEFYPSFSPDGDRVVYTTWNDRDGGSVRVVATGGGAGAPVTSKPGHYASPAFSPDGDTIVYRKATGGTLRTPTWSLEPGLYAVPASGPDGGEPVRLVRAGRAPHFGASTERVYFTKVERENGERRHALKSVNLGGDDVRTHATTGAATEFAVSPDGAWLAFREGYEAHVAAFPRTGHAPLELGPDAKAVPVAPVSRDAGAYLHWSGDSARLYWALGPELRSRAVGEALASLSGDDAGELPPAQGVNIGFSVSSDVPDGTSALVGGRVVTMRGDEVIENGAVVVTGNRIAAVGPRDDVNIPDGAKVIDCTGTTIVPGLVDVHAHGPLSPDGLTPQQSWLHLATLAFGVTTIHDPSHTSPAIFSTAELARAGLITAPRVFSTGTILYGADLWQHAEVETLADARAHVRRLKALGAHTVKSYNQPRRDQRQKVVAAARELEMMVLPEGGSLLQHNLTMVVDGHTGIEHAIPVARAYDDVVQLWSQTDVAYTPTMIVGYGGLWGENYWYSESDVFAHPRLSRLVPPDRLDARARRRLQASEGDWNHKRIAQTVNELHRAGVAVQNGAHGQREGLGAHWELWMFVQGGMSPHEALRASTLGGARYLGMDGDIGSIEVGKLADLAVIEGNPLEDIRASEHVRTTVVNGHIYDAATMNEVGNHPRARPPLFFERGARAGAR